MATLGTMYMTLAEHAKRLDPDGKEAEVVEMLAQTNDMLRDMQFKEGNLPTGNRTTVRTQLPTVYWRLANGGVLPSRSTTTQMDDQCGMLEAFSQVDPVVARLGGNERAFRLEEGKSFLEAMSQEHQGTVIYGNSGLAPNEFTGFAPRFSAISGATNAQNVLSGAAVTGQTDCTSIWLVNWGSGVHGIYPKGSKAGIQHESVGRVMIQNAGGVTGANMMALVDRWSLETGIAVRNWQDVVRICNIDVSNLVAESSAADLTKLMIKAIHRIPSLKAGKPSFYMNRTVAEFLDIQRRTDVIAGGGLDYDSVDGKRVPKFRGIPIGIVDQITSAEAVIA